MTYNNIGAMLSLDWQLRLKYSHLNFKKTFSPHNIEADKASIQVGRVPF
jgi:hypothetical protein